MDKRGFLSHLDDSTLKGLVRVYNVHVGWGYDRDEHIDALVKSRKVTLADIKKTLKI